MTHDELDSAFEVETTSVEEFLRLLSGREVAEDPSRRPHGVAREAVFIATLQDVMSDRYTFPKVTRHVVAAFAYGPDVISYKRTTSHVVELPKIVRELAERQQKAREELREEIERGIDETDLGVPVREGHLSHPTGTSEEEKM